MPPNTPAHLRRREAYAHGAPSAPQSPEWLVARRSAVQRDVRGAGQTPHGVG
jgi:hypothetical protein